jgi:hypothetical protein
VDSALRGQRGGHSGGGRVLPDERRSGLSAEAVGPADIEEYDRVYKKLINRITLSDVSSSFAMERIKHTIRVPIPD